MTDRSPIIEEIIETLKKGQAFEKSELDQYLQAFDFAPDSIFVSFVVKFFKKKSNTNWKAIMEGLERLLERNSDEEQVRVITQHILEPFADSGSNKTFDRELIKPHLGPISRRYLNEYEAFHGSDYRY